MRYLFTTRDHPSADGKIPYGDDMVYELHFPTDDGGKLTVRLGQEGIVGVAGFCVALMRHDKELRRAAERVANSFQKE